MANTALWNKKELKFEAKAHQRHFPAEFLLRGMLSAQYFEGFKKIAPGQAVLDIGCLYANNMAPFADRGCAVYGVEVTEDAVAVARETARAQGIENAIIAKGVNTALPFEDNFFDIVLSINTIHYEESPDAVRAGLAEMKRVLKPGGCLFLSSAGRDHHFVSTAERRGANDYVVRKPGDFRNGENFTFFESAGDCAQVLESVFGKAEVAVITEAYPKNPLQFYIGKCFKEG